MEATRNHRLDNIKGLLIILVFFGHLIESYAFYGKGQAVFQFIYLFHMPAFTFCSGYFASVNTSRKKLWTNIAYPYIIFQSLYYLFRVFVLKETINSVTFLTPSWILWYLLSLFFWNLLLPLFDTSKCKCALLITLTCFLFGLAIGFNPSAGYFLSISRTAVYFLSLIHIFPCLAGPVPPILPCGRPLLGHNQKKRPPEKGPSSLPR